MNTRIAQTTPDFGGRKRTNEDTSEAGRYPDKIKTITASRKKAKEIEEPTIHSNIIREIDPSEIKIVTDKMARKVYRSPKLTTHHFCQSLAVTRIE